MAQRFLALDWDQGQLHLAAATVKGGSIRFQRAVMLEEQGSPNPAQAEEQGRALRERLRAAGIAPAPVLACVGRDRVILKEVRYPEVPDHEEPAVVRFQAVKELTDAADEVVIDHFRLPGAGPLGERRAQVLIVRRELVVAYQKLCQAAGLKFAGMTPRPYGMAACLNRLLGSSVLTPAPEPPGSAVALVTVGERWAEFCIVHGDLVVQARSLVLGPGLASEIRRNLMVYSGQNPQGPVRAVYMALSGEQAALREKLAESLQVPVHPFDPFAGEENPDLPSHGRGTFVGAVGLLHLAARGGELPVNFAVVKQVRPAHAPNRRLGVLVAALAAVLLAGLYVAGRSVLDRKRRNLTEANRTLNDLNRQLAQEKTRALRMKHLSDWEGVPWPDELYDLTSHLPPITRSFKVRTLAGNVEKPSAPKHGAVFEPTKKTIEALTSRPDAKFSMTFEASDTALVNELNNNLRDASNGKGRFFFQPKVAVFSRGVYTKDVYIFKRPPEEYTRKIFPDGSPPRDNVAERGQRPGRGRRQGEPNQ